jgi:hypothetical protein
VFGREQIDASSRIKVAIAITLRSKWAAINRSGAPTTAEGRVERMFTSSCHARSVG